MQELSNFSMAPDWHEHLVKSQAKPRLKFLPPATEQKVQQAARQAGVKYFAIALWMAVQIGMFVCRHLRIPQRILTPLLLLNRFFACCVMRA